MKKGRSGVVSRAALYLATAGNRFSAPSVSSRDLAEQFFAMQSKVQSDATSWMGFLLWQEAEALSQSLQAD
jgi:hypothetical protein